MTRSSKARLAGELMSSGAAEACARELGLRETIEAPGVFRDLGGYSGLREYQKDGVRWLCEHAEEGALLADDLGLGKSCQALRAARALGTRTLVVCPAFVKGVWESEAAKWWQDVCSIALGGTTPKVLPLVGIDLVIINYDVLHVWINAFKDWLDGGTVIFDELHLVKGLTARRTKACQAIAAAARYRIGLTGTPLDNGDPLNIYLIASILNPRRFNSYEPPKSFPFRLRYCGAAQKRVAPHKVVWQDGEPTHVEELAARIKHFVLRRTKSQVMADLSARTRQIIPVKIGKKFQAPIPGALKDDAALRMALDLSADGKIPDAVALAHSHVCAGKGVIVFTHRRVIAEQICEELQGLELNARFVHGGLTVEKRKAIRFDPASSPKPRSSSARSTRPA
jgi:SNF2 family DNA or RNA helicase